MKLNRSLVIGAVAVATAAALTIAPAVATQTSGSPAAETLRSLGVRHGLAIGTAVNMDALADTTDPTYTQIASTQFSTVTPENVMKWDTLEPTQGTYNWGPADKFVAFAQQNHQLIRGHVLVWHSQLPKWLTDGVAAGTISKTQLQALLQKHITDVVTHFKGKIWQWDVVNEAVCDSFDTTNCPGGIINYKEFWYKNLGSGYIADAFRWARAADPHALLFYNDYNIDAFGDGGPKDKTQFVFNMVKTLRAQGVPIDGVGSQGHLSTRYGNYDALQIADALNKFASLGVATALTEVDVRSLVPANPTSDDLNRIQQASAANYSALMQGCLASPHCLSYTVWGFDDKHNWTSTWDFGSGKGAEALAAIYDANYQPKRAVNTLKADLAFSGAPFVQDRIPQRPSR
jgi:endo-1,4-beta-xylanase